MKTPLITKSNGLGKLPSSAEEGRAEAREARARKGEASINAEARVVLVNKIIPLTSTTPARQAAACRATPPQLRRGSFSA